MNTNKQDRSHYLNSPSFQRMSEGKQLLAYYQTKIDDLYKERLAWLSKFDHCNSLLQDKQRLMDQVKQSKDKELELQRTITHHDVALLDQKLNVLRMDRQNINNQFLDAEEILKMEDLMEEYPQELEKHLPCKVVARDGTTIDNELNIHAARKKQKQPTFSLFRQNNSVLNGPKGLPAKEQTKIKYKPSKKDLLKRQIIELRTNQNKQICLLKEQKNKLEELLRSAQDQETSALNQERSLCDKLRKELRQQEKRHKDMAEKYFETRKSLKGDFQEAKNEHQKLTATVRTLQQKVNQEMRVYEKENKAKQTLIMRKSQDFQQDYKARMRAKERNLQALRDNYEKMQEVCIEKIKQLEQTLTIAKHRLHQTEQKRQTQIAGLKGQLYALERQAGEQRAEKARIDEIMRNKIEQDNRKRAMMQEKEEEERKKNLKAVQIQQAYKTTAKVSKPKGGQVKANRGPKRGPRVESDSDEQGSDEQSMALSDLQNIRQQIHKLQNKLQDKTRKSK